MRYYVILDPGPNRPPTIVDVVDLPDGTLQICIDDSSANVDVVMVGSALNIRVRGQVIDLQAHGSPPDLDVCTRGLRSRVRVESERGRSANRRGNRETAGGEKIVRSPMPGRVVRVLVAQGDAIRVGQGLVVLEAMKMENEVRARTTGIVADVHVAPGATVDRNTALVTLL